jgi:hypothetical protein
VLVSFVGTRGLEGFAPRLYFPPKMLWNDAIAVVSTIGSGSTSSPKQRLPARASDRQATQSNYV